MVKHDTYIGALDCLSPHLLARGDQYLWLVLVAFPRVRNVAAPTVTVRAREQVKQFFHPVSLEKPRLSNDIRRRGSLASLPNVDSHSVETAAPPAAIAGCAVEGVALPMTKQLIRVLIAAYATRHLVARVNVHSRPCQSQSHVSSE